VRGFQLEQDGIQTARVKVDIASQNGWADYVFEEDYLISQKVCILYP
jgi:hypothetical protein